MKLSLEAEQATAHLTVLGWKPVKITWSSGYTSYAAENVETGQLAVVRRNRNTDSVWVEFTFDKWGRRAEVEWWVLTDAAVLRLAATIDNALIGWGE